MTEIFSKSSYLNLFLDAFAVHYGGGVCGVLLTPIFMNGGIVHWVQCDDQKAAFLDAGNSANDFVCSYTEYQVFAWNLIGLIAITLWSGGLTALLFYLLNLAGMLRYAKIFHVTYNMINFLF